MTEDLFGGLPEPAAPPAHGTTATSARANPATPATKPARGKIVQAPQPDPALLALAERLPAGLHLGTSSWSYGGWNGLVYQGEYSDSLLSRKGLAAYSQHPLLRAAGIDRGFYAPIPLADHVAYAAQVPAHFRFLVKAPASVCDPWLRTSEGAGRLANASFLDASIAARDFVAPATAGLGTKCGPLLFQLSPLGAMAADSAGFLSRLDAFLGALPPLDPGATPHACYAVELRDASLLTPRFIKLLRARGVRFCLSARERMPPAERQLPAQALMDEGEPGPLVLRWMLHAGFAYEQAESRYAPFDRLIDEDPHTRAVIAEQVVRTLRAGQPAYVIVSNKAEGSAPLTCLRLAEAIAERLAGS
ncbi:DUF72 domain-containing protein [Cupriavidus sp. 2MCAB6]|uniref:DUF72 domain-containing protein n=1 Tax=Cupriavidus sp. 2MCAB6 TaxID=3232981 RepID=UPI003F93DF9E